MQIIMSTREKICSEALRLFVREGIAGTTTRAIATACGIAEGTIYRHFTSKDELALDLYGRNWAAFATYMERAALRGETARERLQHMISWLVVAAERQPDLFDYLFLAMPQLATQLPAEAPSPVACLKQELADLVPPAEIELQLAVMLGALTGAVRAFRAGRVSQISNLPILILKPLEKKAENHNGQTKSLISI